MPIFKREQDPPFNQAAATRAAAAAVAPASAVSAKPAVSTTAAPAPGSQPAAAPVAAKVGAPTTETPPVRPPAAVIDDKTEITGNLKSSGNVLIEGCFHGEVEARETIWVEQGAQSDGQLRANEAVISGSVDGEIDCQRRLQIAAGAVVSGQIKTPILVIEDGATVNCRFSMTRDGGLR